MTDTIPTDVELVKKAKTCMIIGLISLCGGFLLGPIMLPITIFGIIAGAKSYKCSKKNFAITGLVTGVLSLSLTLHTTFLYIMILIPWSTFMGGADEKRIEAHIDQAPQEIYYSPPEEDED